MESAVHDSRRYRDNAAECLLAAQEACEALPPDFISLWPTHGFRSPKLSATASPQMSMPFGGEWSSTTTVAPHVTQVEMGLRMRPLPSPHDVTAPRTGVPRLAL
jgi:hypothetical protein